MLELALKGDKKYWGLIGALAAIAGIGVLTWFYQLNFGLGVTGMSRDVSWGFYIANFTFLVGVAAGGAKRAACRPVSMPLPPASIPSISTP